MLNLSPRRPVKSASKRIRTHTKSSDSQKGHKELYVHFLKKDPVIIRPPFFFFFKTEPYSAKVTGQDDCAGLAMSTHHGEVSSQVSGHFRDGA